MLTLFAGFTACDGFPFGNDDGTVSVIFAFLLAVIAILVLPFWPEILKRPVKKSINRTRVIVGSGIIVLALLMTFSSGKTKTDFNLACDNPGIDFWRNSFEVFHVIVIAILSGIIVGVIIRIILKITFDVFSYIIKSLKDSNSQQ